MKTLENIVALIAPHRCLMCKAEGSVLCFPCREASLANVPGRCYRCHATSRQYSVCKSCKNSTKLSHVWVAAHYEGIAKALLHQLKFERARAGALPAAAAIESILPQLPADILVCHIPTANNRIRRRGYDQAEEVAKELCRLRAWQSSRLFLRFGKARQVGATRKERFTHLEKALRLRKTAGVSGRHVLLVDDVTTTGATIETAAKILKQAGAKSVDAAVFAQA